MKMELERVDTREAYRRIREQIITLQLAPGAAIDEQALASELGMASAAVREALKLLAHDDLVVVTPRHGLYVAALGLPDLEQLSEMRVPLEALAARLAAQRATADDLTVLTALCDQYAAEVGAGSMGQEATIDPLSGRRLLELDHKFHQAIAQAAHNRFLSRTLDHLFGLSQRLWYLALSRLDFLPAAVEEHLALVAAIRQGDDEQAAAIMSQHVAGFYAQVKGVIGAAGR